MSDFRAVTSRPFCLRRMPQKNRHSLRYAYGRIDHQAVNPLAGVVILLVKWEDCGPVQRADLPTALRGCWARGNGFRGHELIKEWQEDTGSKTS